MRTVERTSPDVWHRRKEDLLADVKRQTGVDFRLGRRPGSRTAEGPSGTLYLPAARESQAGRWWLGLNERTFVSDDRAIGVVLLCEMASELLDFWLPAQMVRALLPRLSSGQNHERKFNVIRRHDRFWLQVPKSEDVELTPRRGDTSWLIATPDRLEPQSASRRAPAPAKAAFLARVRKGRLQPLDPVALEEGAVVVVQVSPAPSVPRQASLRRIVAAAGSGDLPVDLAEQHDHYAHGAPRR